VGLCETDGVGGAQLPSLLDRDKSEIRVLGLQMRFNLAGQMTHDSNDLIHSRLLEQIEHSVEHGSVSYAE
jgi:hypothetical protein